MSSQQLIKYIEHVPKIWNGSISQIVMSRQNTNSSLLSLDKCLIFWHRAFCRVICTKKLPNMYNSNRNSIGYHWFMLILDYVTTLKFPPQILAWDLATNSAYWVTRCRSESSVWESSWFASQQKCHVCLLWLLSTQACHFLQCPKSQVSGCAWHTIAMDWPTVLTLYGNCIYMTTG